MQGEGLNIALALAKIPAPPQYHCKFANFIPEHELTYAWNYEFARELCTHSVLLNGARAPRFMEIADTLAEVRREFAKPYSASGGQGDFPDEALAGLALHFGSWAAFGEFPKTAWLGIDEAKRQRVIHAINKTANESEYESEVLPRRAAHLIPITWTPQGIKDHAKRLLRLEKTGVPMQSYLLLRNPTATPYAVQKTIASESIGVHRAGLPEMKSATELTRCKTALRGLDVLRMVEHFRKFYRSPRGTNSGAQRWAIEKACKFAEDGHNDSGTFAYFSQGRYVVELCNARKRIQCFAEFIEDIGQRHYFDLKIQFDPVPPNIAEHFAEAIGICIPPNRMKNLRRKYKRSHTK